MEKLLEGRTPREAGYVFPAEWEPHHATWLSWPHNKDSWPGKIEAVFKSYIKFIKAISAGEYVNINVNDPLMKEEARRKLENAGVQMDRISFFLHPTNDAWCRDHGPAFLINNEERKKLILDWDYNAWGGKYPPYDLDDQIPTLVGNGLDLPVLRPGIIMEGGSVDFNGAGTILTTTSCLLNPNRNPHLNREEIEQYLMDYYGADQVLWLGDGIVGDDTDGHIDDLTRFISEKSVVTVIEHDKEDANYVPLKENLRTLESMLLPDGNLLNIVELPMPDPLYHEGQRLPASYANFYIANSCVVVPTYRCDTDDLALELLQACFTDRKVIGIDSNDLIWGLGSFHCLSQQEPAI